MHPLRRHVFLIDALGAAASVTSPLLVVPALEPWLGLPLSVTWVLALPAVVLGAYSFTAWWRRAPAWPWLLPVMGGNLSFCVFLAIYLPQHADLLTPLGWGWFAGEVAVILAVVAFEAWASRGAG